MIERPPLYSRQFTELHDLAVLAECGYDSTLTSQYRYAVLIYDLRYEYDEGFEPLYKRYFNNKLAATEFCFLQKLAYGDAYVIDFADPEISDSMWQIIKLDAILL